MKKKMMALHKNQIWDLVDLSKGQKVIGCKWVYEIKRGTDGVILRYRIRLVAKRFAQKKGMDFLKCLLPLLSWILLGLFLILLLLTT